MDAWLRGTALLSQPDGISNGKRKPGAHPRPAATIPLKVLSTAPSRALWIIRHVISEGGANCSVVSYLCCLGYAT